MNIFKMMADAQKTLSDNPNFLVDAQKFIAQWANFMTFLKTRYESLDARLDAIDSKLQYIMDGPPIVTPDILDASIKWYENDPRQGEVIPNKGPKHASG